VSGLSPEALDALLRETIVARLATIDDDGYPYVVPVWTEWDGNAMWLVARARSAYVGHLATRPKVAISIVRPDNDDTRALILGRAAIVDGPGPLEGVMEAMARRMARRYEGAEGDRYIDESLAWPRVLVRIDVDRVQSWGDPDWHPRYR
jgi:PPOX class probable F420-dependent enzyme